MPSDSEATRRWLNDIQHHIAMAQAFIAEIDYEAFKNDNLHLYAVTRCLEIISEASRRLPENLKARHPSIQWREMAAAGNIYRHEYEDVAARRAWQTVRVSLPPLHEAVAWELAALQPDRSRCKPPLKRIDNAYGDRNLICTSALVEQEPPRSWKTQNHHVTTQGYTYGKIFWMDYLCKSGCSLSGT